MPIYNPTTAYDALLGKKFLYRDFNFSTIALATGNSAPDLVGIAGGTILVSAFHGASATPVEQVFGSLEMDHDWFEGTIIYPHVHWMPTTDGLGDVNWQITYVIASESGAVDAGSTINIISPASGVAWLEQRADFPAIIMTGKKIGSQFAFRLFRDPAASDTYEADAATLTVGFHVAVNSLGSRNIGVK